MQCSVTCGEGVKTREVVCRNSMKEVVSSTLCPQQSQPKNVRPCQRKDCSLFVWKVGQWSEVRMTSYLFSDWSHCGSCLYMETWTMVKSSSKSSFSGFVWFCVCVFVAHHMFKALRCPWWSTTDVEVLVSFAENQLPQLSSFTPGKGWNTALNVSLP